jgi:hypothetical protein
MVEPEWLTRRGGSLRRGNAGATWFVIIDGKPLYRLTPVPVEGRFGCTVTQTNNGRRIPGDSIADSEEAAVQTGLGDLGKALGWRE